MNNTAVVPELIVIVGPIASGKSTIANGLGSRLRAMGRSVAVLDLDEFVDTIGGFAGLTAERFRQVQFVYGELVGAWLRGTFDVIAHGPFFAREEDEALLHAVPAEVTPRRVQLLADYEVALERTARDPDRVLSKDPKLLRLTYNRVESLLPSMPTTDWTFDTTTRSPEEIVDTLASAFPPALNGNT